MHPIDDGLLVRLTRRAIWRLADRLHRMNEQVRVALYPDADEARNLADAPPWRQRGFVALATILTVQGWKGGKD